MEFISAETGKNKSVIYEDENGNAVVFRGGSRAWRNNNPGNVAWIGVDGDFARRHGAIGKDDGGLAIFPDIDTGIAAQEALLRGPTYRDLAVEKAIRKYAADETVDDYVTNIGKWTGFDMDRTVGSLSENELQELAFQMQRQEGYWKPDDETDDPEIKGGTVSRMPPFAAGREAAGDDASETGPRGGHPSRKPGPAAESGARSDAGASGGGASETSVRLRPGHPGFNRPADPLAEPDEFARLLRFRSPADIDGPDAPERREILDLLRTPVEEWSDATRDHVMRSTLYRRTDDPDHERTVNAVTAWFERRYPEGRSRRPIAARSGRGPTTFSAPRSGRGRSRSRNDESA